MVSRGDSGITCDLRGLGVTGGTGESFQNAIDVTTEWVQRSYPFDPVAPDVGGGASIAS